MRIYLLILMLLAVAGLGCSSKTPEEIEAAKYPPVSRLSPEEEQAAKERFGVGKPRTGPEATGTPGNR